MLRFTDSLLPEWNALDADPSDGARILLDDACASRAGEGHFSMDAAIHACRPRVLRRLRASLLEKKAKADPLLTRALQEGRSPVRWSKALATAERHLRALMHWLPCPTTRRSAG